MGWNTVTFDKYNPASTSADRQDARKSLSGLDYSPLKRVSMRSLNMGILISMGGFIFGYDTGQISGFLEMPDFLERFGEEGRGADGGYGFTNVRSGLIVAMLSIGTLVGALSAAPVADFLGRRISVSIWSVIFAVGLILQIACSTNNSWEMFTVGRLVAGFGVGALSLLVPMYQAETAPRYIRGALISTYQLFITFGIFLAACINYGTYQNQRNSPVSWQVPIGLGFLWALILGLGILLFPETPRFAYRKGRVEEAKKTMMAVYGCSENHYILHVELEEIEAKLRAESLASSNPITEIANMVRAPKMAYRLALGVLLQMFQQLTGANFFFYYGTTIFRGVSISSFVTQMILNGINFGVTFIGLYLVEHYGRRKSLITGSIWMFVCFMIFASVGSFALDQETPTNTPDASVAMIVFAALFILGFATTWGPMVWALIAELYPSRYRAKGMALATASNWLWNFLLAFFTPFITPEINFRYGYVFAGCNVIGGLIVYFFVMEGQGRTLEEIDTMYLSGVKAWKSTQWTPPSAEEMARLRREAGTADDAAIAEEGIGNESDDVKEKKAGDGVVHRE